MIWQIMLDSGATLPYGWGRRDRARDELRRYNARARASRAAVERGEELVSLRLAIALVAFKPRIAVLPAAKQPGRAKGGKARAAKLSPERRSEIAKAAARKRWGNRP